MNKSPSRNSTERSAAPVVQQGSSNSAYQRSCTGEDAARALPLRSLERALVSGCKAPLALGALFLLGCGPALKFTASSAAREPKPPTCPVVVLTAEPSAPYEELGTIDIQYDNTGFINTPEQLQKKLQPEVCKAGGDAALGIANSYGTYIRAKVYSSNAGDAAAASAVGGEAAQDDASATAQTQGSGAELQGL